MTNKTVVLDLDSMDRSLLHVFLNKGLLPNLARMLKEGTYWPLQNEALFISEVAHSVYYTGRSPSSMKFWGPILYDASRYLPSQGTGLTPGANKRLFWELEEKAQVTVFDNPQTWLSSHCRGTQVYGWGYHGPKGAHGSSPEGLIETFNRRYGEHLAFPKDSANLTKPDTVSDLGRRLAESARRRTSITLDLLKNTTWDFFVASFSETHSAPHYLFEASYAKTILDALEMEKQLLECYQLADDYVGKVMNELDPDTNLLVLSVEGMQPNNQDIPSTTLLPEWLYRFSFGGEKGFHYPEQAPARWPEGKCWNVHLLPFLTKPGLLSSLFRKWLDPQCAVRLENFFSLCSVPFPPKTFKQFNYLPAMWYQPLWQRMKAFALPTFSDGAIRINLEGRDPHGMVPVRDYDQVCDEITAQLAELRIPGSNKAAVTRITRTRKQALDPDGEFPAADLSVQWHPEMGLEFECPRFGRFGPVCPVRLGAHNADGFLMARGPSLEAGTVRPPGRVVDIAPTALDLLGVDHDLHFDGHSLLAQEAILPTS